MARIKEWEELTIRDNFLFQKVMQNKRLCMWLITKLLGIKVKDIIYPEAEKTVEASPTQKGIRLDVYVVTEDGTIIDIEMQTADKSLGWLPKRTRYYQAMIDINVLGKGKDYIDLKKSFVIFICTFVNYETSKKRSARKDIGCMENMAYDAETDSYTCANGKKLAATGIRKSKTRTGYVSEKTQYACADCKGCPRKGDCIRAGSSKMPMEERSKRFEVAKKFQEQRKKTLERLTSPEGIELRVNRSIQAEGSFAQTKGNLSFRRFLSRGRKNVLVEAMLLAMAHNMTYLHNKIQAGKEGQHLFPVAS